MFSTFKFVTFRNQVSATMISAAGLAGRIRSGLGRTLLTTLTVFMLAMGLNGFASQAAFATTFTETVPGGNGPIPNTYPPVGGTMFVFVGVNGNLYYQFVNPSTQFRGFAGTGTPAAFQGIPQFQLGPAQTLNCGIVSCNDYFGGGIAEGYARLTVRDADGCPGNFDYQDVSFVVNGITVSSLSDLPAGSVERTNFAGTTTIGTENCFRDQGATETSTSWFTLSAPLLNNILTVGSTTPFINDTDTGTNTTRGDNFWYFTDGNDATGTPEVAPGIEITKTADRPDYTAVGDVINYDFVVRNIGSVTLNNIVVTDSFILGAVSCPLTSLNTGQQMTCTGSHTVTQANIDNDIVFVNTAEVTANPTEGQLGSVSGTLSIPGPAANNSMTLTKVASKTTNVEVNDVITYTYTAQNTGNITLDNVNITDNHPGTGTLSAITPASVNLAPTEQQIFTATYTVTQADIDAGTAITNTATGNSTPKRGTITAPTADATIQMTAPTPEASFSKIASPNADAAEGDLITYTYTVTNTGNVTLNNTSVSDVHGGSGALSAITPASANIAPGTSQDFTATYTITQADFDAGTDISNTATMTTTPAGGTLADIDATEAVALADPAPLATLVKTASPTANVGEGDTITYSYAVENTGDVALNAVSITDVHSGTGTLSAFTPASVATIAPGGTQTFTATYVVTQADVNLGTAITNTATLNATPARGTLAPVTDDASVSVEAEDTSATLTKTPSKLTDLIAGETITYSYEFTNTGNVALTNVSVSDVHNGAGTLGAITPATVAAVLPGNSATFTADYVVQQADIDAGTPVTNTATASATPPRGAFTEPTASASAAPATPAPAATMTKTASDTTDVAEGDVLTYSYVVTNTGNVSLSAVSVSDAHGGSGTLGAITPASVATLAPGDDATFTAQYTVTQADVDAATPITNTATVSATPAQGTLPTVTANESVTVEGPLPNLDITKTASDTTNVAEGDTLTYTYAVTNSGNVTMTNVSVSDAHNGSGTLSAITPASVASLAVGDSQTFTATYVVTQADIDAATPITNTATANATPASGTYTPATADESVTVEGPLPNLGITKTASDTTDVQEGDTITYTYEVTNSGNVTMTNVSISDVHNGAGTLSAITPASVPSLAVGDSQTFTATYVVTQADIDATTPITNTATANATPASGTYTPATADETVTVEGPLPNLDMTKTASNTTDVAEGDTITYTYDVTNSGNVTMNNVSVSDAHNGSGTLSAITPASVATLNVGDSQTFTATYVVTQADIDATTPITNTATANATPASGTYTPVTADESVTVEGAAPNLAMTKTASDTTNVAEGDTITYTYDVTNSGNVTMNNVSVSDVHNGSGALSAIMPASVASLAVGDSATFTATYVVTQADIDATTPITNTATANATPVSGTYTPVTADESVTVEAATPNLAMTKTASDTTNVAVGDTLTYTYDVTNSGNVTMNNVSVSDVHNGSGTLSAITPASVASLAVGDSATFTATYVVTQADIDAAAPITNTATANAMPVSGSYTPVTADESVTVEGSTPDLDITKTPSATANVAEGDTITYTYEVTNSGNVTMTNVSVSDVHNGSGTLSAITPASVASLAVGDSQTFTASYVVTQADVDGGTPITNTATANATPASGSYTPKTADASVALEAPAPATTMTKVASATTNVAVGDVITYTYNVTNSGNTTLADVSVSDVHNGSGALGAIMPATVASLAVGDSATFTADYTVTQADIDAATPITNTATANATPPSGTYTPTTADESVTVEGATPSLSVVKTPSITSNASVGDVITYTYDVTNDGNVSITDVSVSDVHNGAGTLSAITPATVASLAVGDSATFTATYTVTQDDLDAGGTISNTATASGTPSSGTLAPATDTADVSVDTPTPLLAFTKTPSVSTNVAAGDVITYTYDMENTGNVSLTNVSVSDVHNGSGTLSAITPASVATLAVGDTASFSATYTVTQADIDSGAAITNTATVAATPAQGTLPPTTDDASVSVDGFAPSLAFDKRATSTDFAAVGDTLSYEYDVTNDGNVTISGITVSDDKIASVSCPVTTLAPGASTICTADYTVTQVDLNAGSVTNNASVSGSPSGGTLPPATDSETVGGTQSPSMTVAKTALDTSYAAVGDTLDYSYRVTNTGNVEIAAVTVSDDKIASVSCPVTTLASGQDTLCTASYTVTQADIDVGSITNIATASGTPSGGTLTPATDTATVNGNQSPAMSVVKTARDTTFAAVDDILTYDYEVTNTGNVTLTSAITINDDKIAAGDVSCPALPAGGLAPTASITCTGTYRVTQADLDAGSVTNIASATDGTTTSPTDTATVNGDQTPSLDVVKRALDTTFAAVGDTLSYEYDVTNTGNVTLTSAITINDDKIAAGDLSCPALPAGGLAPSASITCSGDYTVTQADLDAGSVTNVASATDGTTTSPTDTATVNGDQTPSLDVVKRALDTTFAAVGDTLSYEYDVTNTGNITLTSAITISDDKIAAGDLSCPTLPAGGLAPTASITCSGDYTVTQADIDAGSVTNIASATDGTTTSPTDTATVNGDQTPSLDVVKRAIDTTFAAVGDTLSYEYDVTNTGNVTLTSAITINDDKIAAGDLSCPALPAGGLAPMATITCSGDYTVTQADLDAGSVTNVASATDGTTTSPTDTATVNGTQAPSMTLAKVAQDSTFTAVGDVLMYDYTATNTGNVLIADLAVTDDKIASVTCNVASTGNGDTNLDPGESVICTASYTVTQADLDAGSVTNIASVTGTPAGGTLPPVDATETVDATQNPALSINKVARETSFAAVGDVLTYDYTVTNTGNVLVSALDVSDDKIATVSCDVSAVGNNDANLDPTEVVVCTATYAVTQADLDAGSVTNIATATATPAGGTLAPPTATETVSADQMPAMEVVKTATSINFQMPGDVTTYEYAVTNTGNVSLTDPITVTDNRIATVSCPALPAGGLAPGATLTCTASYTATQADLDAGSVTNLASATSGPLSSPQTSETIPANQAPGLTVAKAALFTDFTAAGEVVEYEFTLTNTGNLTLTGTTQVMDDKIGTIDCFVGNLPPNGTETCRADYTITQADLDAGSVTNQAYAQNGSVVSPPVDVTVDGTASPSLSFNKRALTSEYTNAGDVVSYAFDVANTGNVTINAISITDDNIANVTCPQTTLAPAATMICNADYTVTQADVDAGSVVNNASVTGTPPTGGTPLPPVPSSVTVTSDPSPAISLNKRAVTTDFDMAGDTLVYEFDVTNSGSVTLSGISVTDDLMITVSCPFTTLSPAQTMVCSANYTVTQNDVDNGSVTNNASVTGTTPDGTTLPPVPSSVTVGANQAPGLSVDKVALDTTFAVVGDTLDYSYIVTNSGNVRVNAISVADDKIPTVSCPVTMLDPADSTTCTATYTVTQADIDAGSVTNIATVTGTPAGGGTLPPATDTVTVNGDQTPALTTVKVAETTTFSAVGDTLDYRYDVTNSGNTTLTDAISVTDDKIAVVNCDPVPADGLVPGATLICRASYSVTQADIDAGSVTNIASATDGTITSPPASETVNGAQTPALVMTKTATPQSFDSLGQVVNYEYVITNSGNTSITTALSVSDDRITNVTCPALPTGGLAPGAMLTCTAMDMVSQPDLDSGQITNIASATDGTTTSPNVTEVITADQAPSMTMAKVALSADYTAVGDTLAYEYTVTNTGNVSLTDPITVTDDKIASVSCPSLPPTGLMPGSDITCSASYVVTQADLDAGSVTNIASAQSGSIVSPTDSATVDASAMPALSVEKTALSTDYSNVGDVVSYEYTVRNTGNVTLTDTVSVSDDKIASVFCPAMPMGGLMPNATLICTGDYIITQPDIDAGSVINIASATSGGTTSPTDSATVTADQMPELIVIKTASQSTFNAPGQTLDYSFEVVNNGNTTLTDPVTVSDSRIASVSCPALPAGGLVPGASITCTGSDTVTQADIDAGVVENIASASSGTTTSDPVTKRVFATRTAAIEIDKTATNVNFTLPGDIVTYEYVVTNSGNTTLVDPITVSDNLISPVSCPASPAGGLAPGASLTCTADYVVTQDNLDIGSVTNIATASSGTQTSAPTSETVPANANPAVELRKSTTSGPFDTAGQILTYTFEMENTGNVTLTGALTVVDNKIGNITCYTGNFVPGQVESCTADYTVTQADIDAGFVTNDAYIEHPRTSSPPVYVTVPANANSALDMVKTALSTDYAAVGDTLDYTYVVTNSGNTTITFPISVSDDRINPVTCPALPSGGLAPGATLTCSASDTVTQADIDAGSVTNTATATDGFVTTAPQSATVNADQTPALSVDKTALDTTFATVGDTLDYEYRVTNTGNVSFTDPVTISDDRIATITCPSLPAGGLAPNATLVCSASDTVTQADIDAGAVTNVATASSGVTTSAPVSVTVTGTQTSALEVVKTAAQTSFDTVGDTLSYTYVVTNTGNTTLTDAVIVSDNKIASVTCPALPAGGLAPAATLTCSADYSVTQADLDAGSVTNLASATSGTVTSPEVSETVFGANAPGIDLVKTALTTDFDTVGDTLDYEYTITNAGNITLTAAITVSDDRIASVSCPALPAGGLTPGASITCTATDTVTQADLDAGFVTNTATATDGTTSSPAQTVTVTGTQNTAFTVDKIGLTSGFDAVGDVLSYDYVVTNTGNTAITFPVTIEDDKIGTISCPSLPSSGLTPTQTLTCTADYTVTQADLNAGFVTNVATANVNGRSSPPDSVTITGTGAPALTVEKSATVTDYTAVGDILSYEYVVTNTGNVTITAALTVSDDKIATVSCPALPAAGLAPGASLTCAADYTVTQADIDAGSVTNIATVSDGTTISPPDQVTVTATATPAMSVEKRAVTADFTAPGDIVSYEYVVTNTGNTTLTDAITIADDKIATVSCPALPASGLAPAATLTCAADYAVTQDDLDAGFVTNLATATSGTTSSPEVSETVDAARNPSLNVLKDVVETRQLFGPIFEVTYAVTLENTGNVTLTDVRLEDALATMIVPATLEGTPVASISGFTGGSVNADYDGTTDTQLISGPASLPVGDAGTVMIIARVDITNGGPAGGNTAYGNARELSDRVPSDDVLVTPNTPDDRNPTPLSIIDTDGDGSPDNYESPTNDRDGDGIPDSEDYDPTGYFYCEENGEILPGGMITVTGPNGSFSGVGRGNGIVIVRDGSDGFFQFYVTQAGRYTLTPTYPTLGDPSTARLAEGTPLDVTSLVGNPGILGSSEVLDSGVLADFSAEANTPFYFEFDIEAGDPHVLMNNIPLKNCGTPELSLDKTVAVAPIVLEDGRQQVTYRLTATNVGQTLIRDLQIEDDLGVVFGADNVEVKQCRLINPPSNQTNVESLTFNGVTDIDTLNGDGNLAPGEEIIVEVDVIINPETDGEFINTANATANGPRDGTAVSDDDQAVVTLLPLSNAQLVSVTKSAQPRTVQIGDPVLYTVAVTNESGSTMTDLRIVDRLPEGFAYIPGSATVADATETLSIEPTVASRGELSWALGSGEVAPLDNLRAGETVTVSLRLLAGPNVTFGAHENQAFAESPRTGTRSDVATAIVDYIPEPSFDCTPVIGRVYDDVNHNGYPDDGEPGLPGVRLVTVNGDIITTDQYGRYHIPCAAIADSEIGSNFLLKADTRTLPLGFLPTTENPRVVRATRGKFVKMNFGAAFRPKLRIDVMASDYNADFDGLSLDAVKRIRDLVSVNMAAERAVIVFHAMDDQTVDSAQDALTVALDVLREYAPDRLRDIAMEASWGEALRFATDTVDGDQDGYADKRVVVGEAYDPAIDGEMLSPETGRVNNRDRVSFVQDSYGTVRQVQSSRQDEMDAFNMAQEGLDDNPNARGAGLRGDNDNVRGDGMGAVRSADSRRNSARALGRRDATGSDTDSARPGRLMRWLGWGNATDSYVDSVEIETTVDALDPVKRLNAQANIISQGEGSARTLVAEGYWNYGAFIERAELRVFDADRSTRSEPVATASFIGDQASVALSADMPEVLHYVLRVYGVDGGFDETASKRIFVDSAENDLSAADWAAERGTAFGQNTISLNTLTVRGGAVRVYGRNVPGDTVQVMGQSVRVDENGRFAAEQLLPAGQQAVRITVPGMDASEQNIVRMVDVKSRETFYVAQVEATIGERIGDDERFEEGRVAFYVRSRINDRWAVTATADTGEAAIEDLFNGLDDKNLDQLLRRLDPDRYYPTYGDDSTIEQDAPTSGRVYARVERDDDYALWGNYQTNFNDTEFARVNRTLYGAKLHWDENGATTKFGDDRTTLTAFVAEGGTRAGRDELRGTGGSVYYLRRGDISIGSEIIRIETRDSVSGLVLETRRLRYGTDYDLDFIQGRIILNQPLGSTGDDGRLFRDGSQSGNRQILVADYEYTPVFGADDDSAVYGARARRWFGDHIKLGLTYNHDDSSGVGSDLYEADITLQHAAGTYIKGEIAQSKGQGVETFSSIDGGFTYNPRDRGVTPVGSDDTAMAYAVEAAVDFSELDDVNLIGTAYGYWRKREAGFAGYAEATNQSVEQFGGGLNVAISKYLSLSARADVTDSQLIGTNSFAEATADYAISEKLTATAGVSFNDDSRGNSGASVGGRLDYEISDDTNVYVYGQVGLTGDNTRTTDRLGAGGEIRLSKNILGGGEISTGEDGLGARASLRYQYEDGDEYYVAYDLPLNARTTSNYGTFNLGARQRYTDALSVYGEERIQFNETGVNGVTHAYGVDYTPGNWTLGISGEVGRVDDLDRTAFSGNVGFAGERFKAGLTGEWREDENVDTGDTRNTWLVRATTQYQASEELRLQGKLNIAQSDQSADDATLGPVNFNQAEFTEASIAAAYRPIWDDRFNLLAKLTYLEDLSPTSQRFGGETLNYRQKSEIVSIDGSYDVSAKWTVGGKYAHRSGSVTSNRESLDFTKSSADLAVLRLDYHATRKWDFLLEGRYLEIGDSTISRKGAMAGLYRHVNDNAKLGVGVTYGGIEEDYLAIIANDDDWGWYLNLVGKF